jgi:ferredoxin
MAYVVTGNCDGCRFTDCVEVCPVNCFYGDEKMLYINPDECIDCDACVPACPVEAIFALDDVPADQKEWIQVNAEKATSGKLENITQKVDPLPTAEEKKNALGL